MYICGTHLLFNFANCIVKLRVISKMLPHNLEQNSFQSSFFFAFSPSVTLSAATPAYFRGFTLIALKEGKEGDKEEDHAGTFQVRSKFLKLRLPRFPLKTVASQPEAGIVQNNIAHLCSC